MSTLTSNDASHDVRETAEDQAMGQKAGQETPQPRNPNRAQLDSYVQTLQQQKDIWANLELPEKFHHIMEMRRKLKEVAERWVYLAAEAKGLTPDSPLLGEEWAGGPWTLAHGLNRYAETFYALEHGDDLLKNAGDIRVHKNGQLIVEVAPVNFYEEIFLNGVRAELWMEPGITRDNVSENMAHFYRNPAPEGKVALVLGAGNVAGIAPLDVLHKLLAEGQVVLLKLNPVNDYLLPVIEELFESLISYGFVRIVTGDADVGAYLTEHPGIDTIHMTGSSHTYDAIVFGTGEEGEQRKAAGTPRLDKPVTAELGNVSPTIVLPGDWSDADIRFQAENIVTQKLQNGGFNCVASQVLILPANWEKTPYLLGEIRGLLRTVPQRPSYYPGAIDRAQRFSASHGRVETIGNPDEGVSHRVLITEVDPEDKEALIFCDEAFSTVLAQTSLPGDDATEFFQNAINFANDTLYGTLGANIIVDPKTLQQMGHVFDNMLADLRYGAIGVNIWIGGAFSLTQTAWGAYPGHTPDDIQSGTGKVHNAFLFDAPQKTVVYAPFRPFPRNLLHRERSVLPKPPWFVTNKTSAETFRRLTYFELDPNPRHLPGVVFSAMRGAL
ncbi:MAG: aldehyde dehydrogenase [Caldilineaceae bacterium]|nr:aldehyde dehydrogenase [Caldilineaceae bacterium]